MLESNTLPIRIKMDFQVKDTNTLIYNPLYQSKCAMNQSMTFLKLWIFLIKVQILLFYLPVKVVVAKKIQKP